MHVCLHGTGHGRECSYKYAAQLPEKQQQQINKNNGSAMATHGELHWLQFGRAAVFHLSFQLSKFPTKPPILFFFFFFFSLAFWHHGADLLLTLVLAWPSFITAEVTRAQPSFCPCLCSAETEKLINYPLTRRVSPFRCSFNRQERSVSPGKLPIYVKRRYSTSDRMITMAGKGMLSTCPLMKIFLTFGFLYTSRSINTFFVSFFFNLELFWQAKLHFSSEPTGKCNYLILFGLSSLGYSIFYEWCDEVLYIYTVYE